MDRFYGGKILCEDAESFGCWRGSYARGLVDVGCGDGRFALYYGRSHGEWAVVGVDANVLLARASLRLASRSVGRGGAPNVRFYRSAAEHLSTSLSALGGFADWVTVLYPWSRLLRDVVNFAPVLFENLGFVAREGARLLVVVNYGVFSDDAQRLRLGLPVLEAHEKPRSVVSGGWLLSDYALCERPPPSVPSSTWGLRLARSRRPTLVMEFLRAGSSSSDAP